MATHTRTSHGVTHQEHLDSDTAQRGTEPPFEPWEGDHTALVHVLWDAEHDGLVAGRPQAERPLHRALFDRLFGENSRTVAAHESLVADLRAILDAHDPDVTPGAARVDRGALPEVQRHESSGVDTTASMILWSRWLAAVKWAAKGEGVGNA